MIHPPPTRKSKLKLILYQLILIWWLCRCWPLSQTQSSQVASSIIKMKSFLVTTIWETLFFPVTTIWETLFFLVTTIWETFSFPVTMFWETFFFPVTTIWEGGFPHNFGKRSIFEKIKKKQDFSLMMPIQAPKTKWYMKK